MTPMRKASHLLNRLLSGWVDATDALPVEVSGLCHDSRFLRAGDLFCALAGSRSHGMRHADQAMAAGARAIVYDPAGGGAELALSRGLTGIPCIAVEHLDQVIGFIADRFFDQPSSRLSVVGVTGTNGKTSCTHFLAQALESRQPSAVIGTLGWGRPGVLARTTHTTPDAIEVHKLLANLLSDGIASVAMEASSHGLDQGRLNGVRFRGGLFTNFSRDHLDYHGSMAAYLEAKLRLVSWPDLNFVVFNLDDDSAGPILERAPPGIRKVGFTLRNQPLKKAGVETIRASDVRHESAGLAFDIHFEGRTTRVSAPLFGDFNVENLLGVLGVLLASGFDLEASVESLTRVRAVPGRMERFTAAHGAIAIVDYAHTPDALHKSLTSLRQHCKGSLWVVFGCGGDRDAGKRPQMGAIAEKLADHVILTDDNPRSEDGDAIISQILGGCLRGDIMVMRDRRSAITHVLQQLDSGDVALIAGKGHEEIQEIEGVKYPFSDRDLVRTMLESSKREVTSCA